MLCYKLQLIITITQIQITLHVMLLLKMFMGIDFVTMNYDEYQVLPQTTCTL